MKNEARRRGVPVVISAPSGAGKTTLCRAVMERLAGVRFSISHTTRAARGRERDGVDYHFVDDDAFERMVTEGAFLEHANVHGRRYGTSRAVVEEQLAAGRDVLFDIDVQGGRQIHERLADAVLVFVLPPDMVVLERRLRGRGSDSEEQVTRRLDAAREEIAAAADLYQYWIVNDDLEEAVDAFRAILLAERQKRVDRDSLLAPFFGARS